MDIAVNHDAAAIEMHSVNHPNTWLQSVAWRVIDGIEPLERNIWGWGPARAKMEFLDRLDELWQDGMQQADIADSI